MKKQQNKDQDKKSGQDKNVKKDLPTTKGKMKKPGDEGFIPQNEYIGDGSAGMSGTSGI